MSSHTLAFSPSRSLPALGCIPSLSSIVSCPTCRRTIAIDFQSLAVWWLPSGPPVGCQWLLSGPSLVRSRHSSANLVMEREFHAKQSPQGNIPPPLSFSFAPDAVGMKGIRLVRQGHPSWMAGGDCSPSETEYKLSEISNLDLDGHCLKGPNAHLEGERNHYSFTYSSSE